MNIITKCQEVVLSDCERDILKSLLLNYSYPKHGYNEYLKGLKKELFKHLPESLLEAAFNYEQSFHPPAAIVFKNLPTDSELPLTPFCPNSVEGKNTSVSENLLCVLAMLFGEPYAISTESLNLVNNLIPKKTDLNKFTGLGSRRTLDYHIENSAMRYIFKDSCTPKGLLIGGLRNEINTPPFTQVSDARVALKRLTDEQVKVLQSKAFIIRVPKRWREVLPEKHIQTNPVPMVEGSIERPIVNAAFYDDMVDPITSEASQAFEAFREAIKDVGLNFVVEEGTAIFINNRVALHSRTAFEPHFDENDRPSRWLQRVFVTDHLWGFRDWQCDKDRVFTPGNNVLCE
ncbi:TauD/TfdA family dioxygenase [Vibrio lentus]|uniref:TauD/TfdA family dioxygenase n=1 Tax=Vibrio lentus TaxID=136468 RepID=UPI000C85E25C|nr:TauD/TfdA family dioxygenase [Vibrio lentus]MCC4838817.1 TauD/TfdA family dioxygenase [Vibrio lentus]